MVLNLLVLMRQLLEQDGPVRREHDPDLEAAAGPRGFLRKIFERPGRASFDEAMFLPSDAPLSDHPDLDASAAANTAMRSVTGAFADAAITMHPVTGAFADPSHETAFAAHLFRLAFPCHAFLMSLLLGLTIWTTLGAPAELSSVFVWRVIVPILALGLVGRVLVHRMHDTVRGQRIGSWAWMALVVLANTADMCGFLNAPAVGCAQSSKAAALLPLLYLATALTNGTHGLGFVLKAALLGLVLVTCFFAIAVCGEAGLVLMLIAMVPMTIVGFVLAHMAEVHLRHSYVEKQRLEERNDEESRRLEERNEQLQAEKERLLYDVQRRGRPLDDGDDRSAIRRGLQGPSQPYHRADSTNSSDTRAPDPSDSPLPSMPPGPPSSSERESGKSGQDTGDSSRAVHGKSTPPPPTWAELDAQFYAERAAESAAEQEMPAGAPPSTAGAQPRSAGRSKALPPPSWAELAYRRFYAERAAQSSIIEQGVPPPMGQPPTWAELGAEPDRQWLEDRALVVALVASNSSAAEVTSGQEVVEEMVTEMATQEEGAASTGTVCIVHRCRPNFKQPNSLHYAARYIAIATASLRYRAVYFRGNHGAAAAGYLAG